MIRRQSIESLSLWISSKRCDFRGGKSLIRRLRVEYVVLIFGLLLVVTCAWGQTAGGPGSSAGSGANSQAGSASGNASDGSSGTAFVATQGGDFSGSVPTQPVAGVL